MSKYDTKQRLLGELGIINQNIDDQRCKYCGVVVFSRERPDFNDCSCAQLSQTLACNLSVRKSPEG